jgi:uncharacterized caspase-like protein
MPPPSLDTWIRRSVFAACAALLAACTTTPREPGTTKLALVIGNAAYENAPALKNPVNDANDMCAALRKLGFKTLCHTNLRDRAEFDARVGDYINQLGPSSVGVVFYSGHGVQADEANFLIPTQVQPKAATEDPLRVLYPLNELFMRLEKRPTKFQLVILDACRTDLFAQAPRPAGGRGPDAVAVTIAPTGLVRALEAVGRASYGLAPITNAPPGTVVFYATASKAAAYDGAGRNGPLTKHILANIGTPNLYVRDLLARVTTGVKSETRDYKERQTPFTYGSLDNEEFCFAGCRGVGFAPPPMN